MKFPYLKEHYTLNDKNELINPKEINSFYKIDPLLFALRCQIEIKKTTKEEFDFLIEHSDCQCVLKDENNWNALMFCLYYNKILTLNKEQIYKIYEKSNKSHTSRFNENALEFIIKYNTFSFTGNEIINFIDDEKFYSKNFTKEDAYYLLLNSNNDLKLEINHNYLKNIILKLDPTKSNKDHWNSFLLIMLYNDFLGLNINELMNIYNNTKLDRDQVNFIKTSNRVSENYNNFLLLKKSFLEKEEITKNINIIDKPINKNIKKI